MKENIKNTILLSVGPHQVIAQYIVAKQKGLDNKIIGVIRTNTSSDGKSINKKLIKCENYVHNILNVSQISHLKSVYRLWGTNKLNKLVNLLFLKNKIRKMFREASFDYKKVKDVILTARYDLGEILILSSFPNIENIYFVSDGNPILYNRKTKYKIPFYLSLFNFTNPFTNNPEVYFFKENLPNKYYNIIPKTISNEIHLKIKQYFLEDDLFKKWLGNLFNNNLTKTIVFLHPLSVLFDFETNVYIYKKIILKEIEKSENTIVIKQHPREQADIFEKFKRILKDEFGLKVQFFDKHFLSRLPIELYSETVNTNRVVSFFSSSVLFMKKHKIVLYSSKKLPKKYIEITENFAEELNTKIIYIDD